LTLLVVGPKKSYDRLSIPPGLDRPECEREDTIMQYLLLIYSEEKVEARMSESERQKMHADYGTFTKGIVASGHFKGGNALQPTPSATTVRVREGKTLSTHGPFAETREQLGGYYLVEAKDLDEATSLAARIPSAKTGSIEIRPIMNVDM
jgi:hypothetical protein